MHDAIIIGGGHNGLVTAAYLAKAGLRVLVLERRHVLGGASVTEELWPGYRVSVAAYVISLFLPEIIRELGLRRHGLEILPRNPSSYTPLEDGRSLLLGPDETLNRREIARFSQRDADAFPRYEAFLDEVARTIEPVLMDIAPDPLPLPSEWRRIGVAKRLADAQKCWSLFQAFGKLGNRMPEALELLLGAARPILDRWFESDVLKATLATDAIIGSFQPISAMGSAYVLLHHVMGEAGGRRGVWGYVRGGMGGLADALERSCTELGVEIRREAEVRRIVVRNGRIAGVALDGGETLSAPIVASSVDPHWTFERFLEPSELPAEFNAAVARIDYSSASAKINLALSEAPRFTAAAGLTGDAHLRGTIHIGPSLEYLERAYDDARYGEPSREPILEITLPSVVDDSLAPPGHHVMSIFVQYAPYKLSTGDWDARKEAFADRCLATLARFAPNVPASVLHRQVLSPLDLQRTFRLTGGNIFQGAMSPLQLFSLRPAPGWADHRTPIAGLYVCGAASHPGGGVMGVCGRNAARQILRDR